MKRLLRKENSHDFSSRDKAILIINGEVLEGSTHASLVNQYLADKNTQGFSSDFKRPDTENDDSTSEYKLGFAHKLEYMKEVWLETNSLQNLSIDEACSLLKNKYPDFPIYNDDVEYNYMDYDTDGTTLLMAKVKE